jgi:sigma-E factor negative regulatory protein RseB
MTARTLPHLPRGSRAAGGPGAVAFLVLLGALWAAPPVHARPAARALSWIVRMQEVLHRLTYEGRYVFVEPPLVVAFAVRHAPGWEEVTTLDGPRRMMVRVGRSTEIRTPAGEWIRVGGTPWYTTLPPRGRGRLLLRLVRYYRMRLVGEGRVAGERTALVVVAPRDVYRYGYRFWIARRTRLPLRTVLVAPNGRVLEQMMFVDVSFPVRLPPPGRVQWRGPGRERRRAAGGLPRTVPDVPECRPLWLPPGFRVMSDEVIPEGRRREPTRHLLVSDGLGSFSIFVRPLLAGEPPPLLGANSLGPISAYGRVIGDYAVTVVGTVPPITVRTTAEHIVLVPSVAP